MALGLGFHNSCDGCYLALPLPGFVLESLSSTFREEIVLGATVVLRGFPFSLDATSAFKPEEGGKQRPSVDTKNALAGLLDAWV